MRRRLLVGFCTCTLFELYIGKRIVGSRHNFSLLISKLIIVFFRDMKPENILLDDQGRSYSSPLWLLTREIL